MSNACLKIDAYEIHRYKYYRTDYVLAVLELSWLWNYLKCYFVLLECSVMLPTDYIYYYIISLFYQSINQSYQFIIHCWRRDNPFTQTLFFISFKSKFRLDTRLLLTGNTQKRTHPEFLTFYLKVNELSSILGSHKWRSELGMVSTVIATWGILFADTKYRSFPFCSSLQ